MARMPGLGIGGCLVRLVMLIVFLFLCFFGVLFLFGGAMLQMFGLY